MSAHVYILQGTSGRHYIGSTEELEQRIVNHNRGNTATTVRLGLPVKLLAARAFENGKEARRMERLLKSWKNPQKVLKYLSE